jgi:molybdate transport system regulatory protein
MNRLRGRIAAIQCNGHLSLVDVEVGSESCTAVLLETPQNTPYLEVGHEVSLLFKETEVSLAKNLSGLISLRNRLPVTVMAITRGEIMSEVKLDYQGYPLCSIVTTRAVERLGLVPGDAVEALVKSNEMSLMEVSDDV